MTASRAYVACKSAGVLALTRASAAFHTFGSRRMRSAPRPTSRRAKIVTALRWLFSSHMTILARVRSCSRRPDHRAPGCATSEAHRSTLRHDRDHCSTPCPEARLIATPNRVVDAIHNQRDDDIWDQGEPATKHRSPARPPRSFGDSLRPRFVRATAATIYARRPRGLRKSGNHGQSSAKARLSRNPPSHSQITSPKKRPLTSPKHPGITL